MKTLRGCLLLAALIALVSPLAAQRDFLNAGWIGPDQRGAGAETGLKLYADFAKQRLTQ